MKALARLPAAQGIAAMQSSRRAQSMVFQLFFGTAAACFLLAVAPLWTWHEAGAIQRLIGSALYLAGTIAVTTLFNVPRNDALAAADPASAEAASV
jgi:uncharacterized membrane protein